MTEPRHESEQDRTVDEAERDDVVADDLSEEGNGPAAVAEADEADVEAALETEASELEQVHEELKALEERHLRLAAEFDNYRKRNERERVEQRARSQAQVVADLLEALDDLERVAHVDVESATVESLLEGVQLVERKLRRSLESAGLEVLEAEGEVFDPNTMDAMMTVPTPIEEEEDTVADVFQKGYRFKDVLIRPARVRVKKYDPDVDAEDA